MWSSPSTRPMRPPRSSLQKARVVDSVILEEFAKAQQNHTVPALLKKVLTTRVKDTRFVLDELTRTKSPNLDLSRIGMFGQSAGGFTAAQTMYEDPRIKVGIDMDGTLGFGQDPATAPLSPVAAHGLNRPFLLMGSWGKDWQQPPARGHLGRVLVPRQGLEGRPDPQPLRPRLLHRRRGTPPPIEGQQQGPDRHRQPEAGDRGGGGGLHLLVLRPLAARPRQPPPWQERGRKPRRLPGDLRPLKTAGRGASLAEAVKPTRERPSPPAKAAEGATPPRNLSGARTARTRRPLESGADAPAEGASPPTGGEALRHR